MFPLSCRGEAAHCTSVTPNWVIGRTEARVYDGDNVDDGDAGRSSPTSGTLPCLMSAHHQVPSKYQAV